MFKSVYKIWPIIQHFIVFAIHSSGLVLPANGSTKLLIVRTEKIFDFLAKDVIFNLRSKPFWKYQFSSYKITTGHLMKYKD